MQITCPYCKTGFEPGEAVMKEYREKLQDEWKKMKTEIEKEKDALKKEKQEIELKARKNEEEMQATITKAISDSKDLMQQQFEKEKELHLKKAIEDLQKKVQDDYEGRLKMLETDVKEKEDKLKQARDKELELLKKEQQLKDQQSAFELEMQKKLIEQQATLSEKIRKEEKQLADIKQTELILKNKELEKQLEDQKKLADEMKRKADQKSMQLQGEVQELLLEDLLRTNFPFDEIVPVAKGVRGADCIQHVKNNNGQLAGKIIYESKRTKEFGGDWIEKLKVDMLSQNADMAIIVTHALPKDMMRFGEKDGVYICSFAEVSSLTAVLRNALIKIAAVSKAQENKGEKMTMLYNYLTGNEFNEQWNAIREGFLNMKNSIQKERDAMEKLWKNREKQLERVLLNAAHIKGSIEGIAGEDSFNLSFYDDSQHLLE